MKIRTQDVGPRGSYTLTRSELVQEWLERNADALTDAFHEQVRWDIITGNYWHPPAYIQKLIDLWIKFWWCTRWYFNFHRPPTLIFSIIRNAWKYRNHQLPTYIAPKGKFGFFERLHRHLFVQPKQSKHESGSRLCHTPHGGSHMRWESMSICEKCCGPR